MVEGSGVAPPPPPPPVPGWKLLRVMGPPLFAPKNNEVKAVSLMMLTYPEYPNTEKFDALRFVLLTASAPLRELTEE